VGHYSGRGTMAAAMVHRVIMIYEDVCCVLCVCCTKDYFHVVKTVRGQFFLAVVACVVRKTTSTWSKLSADSFLSGSRM